MTLVRFCLTALILLALAVPAWAQEADNDAAADDPDEVVVIDLSDVPDPERREPVPLRGTEPPPAEDRDTGPVAQEEQVRTFAQLDQAALRSQDLLPARYVEEIADDVELMSMPPAPERDELIDNPGFEEAYENYYRRQQQTAPPPARVDMAPDEARIERAQEMEALAEELVEERLDEVIYPENPGRDLPRLDTTPEVDVSEEPIDNVGPIENSSRHFQLQDRPLPMEYLDDLRAGIPDRLQLMVYDETVAMLETLQDTPVDNPDGSRYTDPIVAALLIDANSRPARAKVMEGLTGMLLNPDPQVRLVALRFYRRLIPDMDMVQLLEPFTEIETVGRHVAIETVIPGRRPRDPVRREFVEYEGDLYEFLDATTGENVEAAAYQELRYIAMYAMRRDFVRRLRDGEADLLRRLDASSFSILGSPIDGEVPCAVPLNWFHRDEFQFLLAGLSNPDAAISRRVFDALVRVVREPRTLNRERLDIMRVLRSSRFREEVIRDSQTRRATDVSDQELVDGFLELNGTIQPACQETFNDRFDARTGPLYPRRNYQYEPYIAETLDPTEPRVIENPAEGEVSTDAEEDTGGLSLSGSVTLDDGNGAVEVEAEVTTNG